MTPGMTLLGPALGLSAILFSLGVAGVVLRRNAIVLFVWLAMDAGRYRWATELIGRSVDAIVVRARRALALVRGRS